METPLIEMERVRLNNRNERVEFKKGQCPAGIEPTTLKLTGNPLLLIFQDKLTLAVP